MQLEIPIYHDVWMDNGVENLWRMLDSIQRQEKGVVYLNLEPDKLSANIENLKRFVNLVSDSIQSQQEYLMYWKEDEKTKIKSRVKKRYVLLQPYFGFNINERIYNKSGSSEILTKLLEELSLPKAKQKKRCILCGRLYGWTPSNLKQAVYPFVTKIKSLSGVRTKISPRGTISGMKFNFTELCPLCYLVGALEWTDPTIIYRSFIGGRKPKEAFSIVLLPFESDLIKLKEVKDAYRHGVETLAQEKISNIKVFVKRKGGEGEESPIAKFTLLLGFLEKFLRDYSIEKEVLNFFDCRRKVSENWMALEIPEGAVKDIKAHPLIIGDDLLKLLVTLIESDHSPYRDFLGPLWLKDPEGKPVDQTIQNKMKEELARCLITDDFDSFAASFIPKRGASLVIYKEGQTTLEEIIKEWRWYKMGLKEEDLGVVKKAARVVAKVGGNNLSLLYKMERARNLTELLRALTQVSHKIIGMKAEELRFLSMDSVERLVEMLHSTEGNPRAFDDLRNTLLIFASTEWGKGTFRGGE